MKRNTLKKYAGYAAAVAVAGLVLGGCIKDDYSARGNATVTMTFTTRANNAPQVPEDGMLQAEASERMKTLRVIVVRSATEEVLFNDKYTIPENEHQKTINYSELTINENGEDFEFFAIANEESFNAGTSLEGKNLDVSALKNRKIKLGVNAQSYGITLTTNSLPQTGYMKINVSPENDGQNYNMPLQFAVAKARITFLNTTKDEQTVNNVRLLNVQPTDASNHETELFRDTELQTPAVSAEGSMDVNLGNVTDIPAATAEDVPGSKAVTCYFYETVRGTNPYKLTARWNNQDWEIDLDDHAIEAINRGQMLDITVTLIKKEGLKVSWTVKDWEADDDASLEFTSQFNGSLTGQLIKTYTDGEGNEYVAVAEGQDSQQAERYAQFRFVMTSPVGATWTAHLTDGDYFEFVGPYSGTGVTQEEANEGQGVVTLTVKPRYEFVSGETHTARLYIVVDGLDGEEGELEGAQLINGDGSFPGSATYIDIIQISTADYDNIQAENP